MIQIFLFAFCDRAPVLLIRSPSRNHLDPTFFLQTGENPYDAVIILGQIPGGCEPELCATSLLPKDNGCTWNVFFFIFFVLFCFILFKSSFRIKHNTSHAQTTKHQKTPS